MNKILLLAAFTYILLPVGVRADSYDGPFCYEDPLKYQSSDDPTHIRGTCKFVNVSTVVTLDSSLTDKYLLGTHEPLSYNCEIGCDVSKFSEIITPSSKTVIELPDVQLLTNVPRGQNDQEPFFQDKLVLLDKTKTAQFLGGKPVSKIVVFNHNELNKIQFLGYASATDYNGKDIEALMTKGVDPAFINNFPITGTSSAAYTLRNAEFGRYIQSVQNPYGENPIAEGAYVAAVGSPDKIGLTLTYGYKGRFLGYTAPVTNPVKSVKDYWSFVPKNGTVVFAWQKTEYVLDDGSTKVVTATKEKGTVNATTSPAAAPITKQGFLSRLWESILSWFK